MNEKKALRNKMRTLRDLLSAEEKSDLDHLICLRLQEIILQLQVKTVHTFLPMGSEVDIMPVIQSLLQAGITVVTPKVLPGKKLQHLILRSLVELEAGVFGTKHPAIGQEYQGEYDLIMVPGLAFDRQFNRIGYGQGFYDLFLKDQPHAYKLGIAYPFQIVDNLPVEPHDVPLDGLLY